MAVRTHILPNQRGQWAAALGAGLGEGVASLARDKLERMQQQNEVKQWIQAGADPATANIIARLPPQQRWNAFAQYSSGLTGQQEEAPGIAALQQQEMEQQPSGIQQLQQPQQQFSQLPQADISQLLSSKYSSPIAPEFLQQMLKGQQLPQQQQQQMAPSMAEQVQQQAAQPKAPIQPPSAKKEEFTPLVKALGRSVKGAEKASTARSAAQQKAIDTQNAPFIKGISKAVDNAESALDALQNMKQLLDTGKVSSGLMGKLPLVVQNEESQLFDKYSNQLAQQLSSQSGVPSDARIKFAVTQKPNLEQKPETQRRLIEKLMADAERVIQKGRIKDEIIEENEGQQPPNLQTIVNKRFNELEKSSKSASKQDTFYELPNPSRYKGETIVDEDTGQKFISDGKEWKRSK